MVESYIIDSNSLSTSFEKPFDASFRIIVDYVVATDEMCLRFDVKDGSQNKDGTYKQFCSAFNCGKPADHEGGNLRFTRQLFTPKNGILNCININVNKQELIRALKELVSDLEGTENARTGTES